jgi:hypothetical protein
MNRNLILQPFGRGACDFGRRLEVSKVGTRTPGGVEGEDGKGTCQLSKGCMPPGGLDDESPGWTKEMERVTSQVTIPLSCPALYLSLPPALLHSISRGGFYDRQAQGLRSGMPIKQPDCGIDQPRDDLGQRLLKIPPAPLTF